MPRHDSKPKLDSLGGQRACGCCVPGTARILKGGLSIAINIKLNKSQTQPDGGEGYSGKATGCR